MAQSAFFANNLKVIDQGEFVVLDAQRQCAHGQVMDRICVTLPAELKHLFSSTSSSSDNKEPSQDAEEQKRRNKRFNLYHHGDN